MTNFQLKLAVLDALRDAHNKKYEDKEIANGAVALQWRDLEDIIDEAIMNTRDKHEEKDII